MLYLVLGNERQAQKKYIHELEKKVGGDFNYFDKYSFSKEIFESQVFGLDIFGAENHIVLDEVCETRELQDYILALAPEIEKSNCRVVLLQKDLYEEVQEGLSPYLTEVVEFKAQAARADFSLWAAYFARDKKASWLAYTNQSQSEPIEKIHGGLLGQTKNMYKIKLAPAGANYKKLGFSTEKSLNSSASAAQKFTKAELAQMYFVLVEMPLRAHNGESDFKLELEKFILTYL